MPNRCALCIVLGLSWIASTYSYADLPSIRFDRLKPLGAAAGSTVEVEINGRDIEDVNALRFDRPGLKAELVKANRFKITIAADVPEGTYDVRLVGRFGVSNPRLFAVSHGLKDVEEKEPNNSAAEAQRIEINTATYGASDGNGQDVYRFVARQGQRITLECQAGKLDSEMDAALVLSAADGRQLASNGDYFGRDPFIDFIAPADGEYLVVVNDLSYRGGFPYRLVVTDLPQVENVFPRAVEPGKPVELTVLGRNFGTAGQQSTWKIDNLPLEEFRFRITSPADADALGSYRFLEHPTDHSVLPTAATCTLNGFQLRVPLPPVAGHAATLMFAEGPVTNDAEPNDDPAKAQAIALPATINGRFDRPRDADWFEFTAAEDGPYFVEVYSERIAGRADPFVVVLDDKDNRMTELDDFGHRMQAFDGHLRDPVGSVNLNKGRKYRLLVQDRYGRGGARYQYVLTVRRPIPDFFIAAMHSDNPGPGALNPWRGGAAYVDLVVHYRDGFRGPLTITAEDLPPGMHAVPVRMNGDTRGTFVLWSDAHAPEWTGAIRLVATAERDGTKLRREVRPYTRIWNNQNLNSSRPMRELVASLQNKAPYELRMEPESVTVEAGGKIDLKLIATRHWPDFKSDIRVIAQYLPANMKIANSQVPVDQSEATCSLTVPPNTPPGEYTLTMLGQAQVPFSKDANAANKPNTLVSTPCRPLTVVVVTKK